jgi:hypothetical protein
VTDTISGRLVERQREDPSWYLELTVPVVAQEGEAILSALTSDRALSPEWECGSGGEGVETFQSVDWSRKVQHLPA